MDVGDGKELGLVFDKEVFVEDLADISIESETLGGAVETARTVPLITTKGEGVATLQRDRRLGSGSQKGKAGQSHLS